MKSNVLVLIFEESLDYKNYIGFFVPVLEVPIFGPSIWPLSAKGPELGPQKRHFHSTSTKKLGYWPKNSQICPKICNFGHFGPNIGIFDPFRAMLDRKIQ